MPTMQQLIRKDRGNKVRKSKSPVLGFGLNTIQKKTTKLASPQKRGVCTRVGTKTPKKPNSGLNRSSLSYRSWYFRYSWCER